MKLSYEWIKDFVPLDIAFDSMCETMTLTGSKVEEAWTDCDGISGVVIGEIETIEKHPNADRLVICTVNTGATSQLQIVTGATNVREGQWVPVATVGAVLADNFKIKKSKLRGVTSYGMLCSLEELGLDPHYFPDAPDDGIYIIDRSRYEKIALGQDVCDALGLRDEIVDFEITPNRPDCLSVRGIAREAAASFELPFVERDVTYEVKEDRATSDDLSVKIEANDLCPRFMGAVIRNVRIEPSPEWICRRLRSAGVRPLNNVVDITNFVMLETGQPLHAYDLRDIKKGTIIVRTAEQGETLTTLDGQPRALTDETLVICDGERPIGLAGIMGGLDTEIKTDTTTVVLESALFDAQSIHRTAARLGMRTEASQRFERGLQPEHCFEAMELALGLIDLLKAGDISHSPLDCGTRASTPVHKIYFSPQRINTFLGTDLTVEETLDYIKRSYSVTEKSEQTDEYVAYPPYWRPDLKAEADLSEEVARFYGYNHIPSRLSSGTTTTLGRRSRRQNQIRRTETFLRGCGYDEVCTVSFDSPSVSDHMRFLPDDSRRLCVTIENPLASNQSCMRTSPLPELIRIAARNIARGNPVGRIFELSTTYHPASLKNAAIDERYACAIKEPSALPDDDHLPAHRRHVALANWQERSYDGEKLYLELKGIIEQLASLFGLHERLMSFESNTSYAEYHPGRSAVVRYDGDIIGAFGVLHPRVCEAFEVTGLCGVADLALDAILRRASKDIKVKPIPAQPSLVRDLAIVTPDDVPAAAVRDFLLNEGGHLLQHIELFDVYSGPGVGAGFVSRAYTLAFNAYDHSLSDEEVNPIVERMIKQMAIRGWSLR